MSNEESDLFLNANCNIDSKSKLTFTSKKFEVSANVNKEEDSVKKF